LEITKENLLAVKKRTIICDIIITIGSLLIATTFSVLFFFLVPENHGIIYLIYILALVCISRYTSRYLYGIVGSLIAVICVNYTFTYPFMKLNFTLAGYPLTFLMMLTITLITCTLTSHLRRQSEIIREREILLREAEMEKMRANLLRAVSHDLRTPLTGMIGNSSIYIENYAALSDSDRLDLVRSINNDSNWLLNMVENLLTITRIKGDNFKIKTSLEPVEEVVSAAILKLNKRFPNTEIHATVPEEMLFVSIDAVLIEQVIINLVENAIVHSGSIKPVELAVTHSPSEVAVSITDYGRGIAPEKLHNLFDGGSYQSEESPDSHKGMGIGLSICKTIITAHRGNIYGENHAEGARFCFTLPKED